jgi:hypothetical protein
MAGQNAELTCGTGQNHLIGAAIKHVLVWCQHAEGEGHEPGFEGKKKGKRASSEGM